MYILFGILVVLALILGIAIIGKESRKVSGYENNSNTDLEGIILKKCKGNRDAVESLVEYEREIRPKISRKQAIRNALYRIKHKDN